MVLSKCYQNAIKTLSYANVWLKRFASGNRAMANLFKDSRVCECGYTTQLRPCWSRHLKSCKHLKENENDKHIATLEQQLAEQKEQMTEQKEQLKEYMKQLATKDEQILNLTNQLLQHSSKRLNAHEAQKNAKRKKLSEPERRKIAMRQDWNCANPDGKCCLRDKLQEYDIDHIIPLCQGGQDDPSNFQAICPACHRRKTERDLLAVAEPLEAD